MKDHQIREVVNTLRDIAIEFHGTQQLRERIAYVIVDLLKDPPKDVDAIVQVVEDPPDIVDLYHEMFKDILKTYNEKYPNLHPNTSLQDIVDHIKEKI